MGKSKEVEALDIALEEIKVAKEKLASLRRIVESINGDAEKYDKKDKKKIENGAKRVEAMVEQTKKAHKKL